MLTLPCISLRKLTNCLSVELVADLLVSDLIAEIVCFMALCGLFTFASVLFVTLVQQPFGHSPGTLLIWVRFSDKDGDEDGITLASAQRIPFGQGTL